MNFSEWVVQHTDAIVEARKCSVQDLSPDPGMLSKQLQDCRKHYVAIGELKSDAVSWVNKTYALAVVAARDNPKYNGDERKAMAEADDTYNLALKLKDDLSTTMRALDKMHFEILNDRRSHFPTNRSIQS